MLAPDDRGILLDNLRPPAGYSLDAAVATTFTLDLQAAIIPPLALSSFSIRGQADPVSALEAVRASADRVDIFCQGGCISIPAQAPDLLAFAEQMVHPVTRPAGRLFHPKIWFVRYSAPDESVLHRLLVLSRNLTNDRSWDLLVRMDSTGSERRRIRQNAGLAKLVASLPARSIRDLPKARADRVLQLAEEAHHLTWELPAGVTDYDFHFLDGKSQLDFSGRRHLVVSPFLNDAGLQLVAPDDVEVTVVSRREELEKVSSSELERVTAFVIDSLVGIDPDENAASAGEPGPEWNLLSDLHAKMYVVEPHGRAQSAVVRIGSANATDAAFGGNIEFLVEFTGPRRLLGVDAFLGESAGLRAMLTDYRPTGSAAPANEADQWEVENMVRKVSEIPHRLKVISSAAAHSVTLSTERPYNLPEGWRATIELLTLPGRAAAVIGKSDLQHTWAGVATADLTPFLAVRVETETGLSAGTVVLGELIGAPADRLDVILARQIDTPEKFLRFLMLILSLGDPYLLNQLTKSGGAGAGLGFGTGTTGILELVLRALHDRPQALQDIERLVTRLQATEEGRALLPEGFETLWSTVESAQKSLMRGKA